MERNLTNIKERILYYTDLQGFSKEKFFEELGVTYGSFKGKAKEQALSSDIIERIITKYNDLNPLWLLTGQGSIKINDVSNIVTEPILSYRKTKDAIYDIQRIPVYNLDATMGLVPVLNGDGIDQEKIIDYISLGMLPACDGATSATGDSMYPLLKAGDIVAYKNINVDRNNIYFGEMYLLSIYIDETTTVKTIKFVQPSELGSEYIKLKSQNQHHADKDVKLSQIAAMALVRASIRIHM